MDSSSFFQKCVQRLIDTDRFYATLLQQCRRVFTDKVPTAGVALNTNITLYINPTWFATLEADFATKVLIHEMRHLIMGHITRVKMYPDFKMNHTFYNQCMDLAVNSTIDFPNEYRGQTFCTVENFNKSLKEKNVVLQPGRPFEYYVEMLKPVADKMPSHVLADDHSEFAKEGEGDIPNEVRDQTLRHAVKQAAQAAAGSVPGDLKALVDSLLNYTSPNNWRKELQRFPTDCEVVATEGTRSRRNRRYGFAQPGKKPVRKVHLGLGFDVSGSMWDPKVLGTLETEVNQILKSGCELTVIFFDAEVQSVYKVDEKLELNGKHATSGGGGTDFKCVFTKADELRLDGIIMVTDGYADLHLKYNKPCIWAIYGKTQAEAFKANAPFGKVLHIEEEAGK